MNSSKKSPVFELTYLAYLEQLRQIDYLAKADALGGEMNEKTLLLTVHEKRYAIDSEGIRFVDSQENVSDGLRVMISKYLLLTPEHLPQLDSTLIPYREFKGAAPLVSYFSNNAIRPLENRFANNLDGLLDAGRKYGAQILDSPGHDLSLQFYVFPRIPVIVNFNDADEILPASCTYLYHRSASCFLDMECLAMTGPLIATSMISELD